MWPVAQGCGAPSAHMFLFENTLYSISPRGTMVGPYSVLALTALTAPEAVKIRPQAVKGRQEIKKFTKALAPWAGAALV